MVTIDREYLLDVLRRLIAINSINPSLSPGAPGEAQIALSIAELCRDLGLDVKIVDAAPVTLALSAAGQRVLGAPPRLIGLSPWMDSAILGAAGIPTVIFGPSGAGAHAIEEYADAESVLRCAQVLAQTAVQFCGAR